MPRKTKPHRLLPHERWFAALVFKLQRTHRTAAVLRMEYNFGPERITLVSAALTSLYVGAVLLIAGFVLMILSGNPPAHSGLVTFLDLAGLAAMVWTTFRVYQSARARDAFRAERPYERR